MRYNLWQINELPKYVTSRWVVVTLLLLLVLSALHAKALLVTEKKKKRRGFQFCVFCSSITSA